MKSTISTRPAGHCKRILRALGVPALALFLVACSSDNDGDFEPPVVLPFQELYDQGITRYIGMYSPSTTETDGNITRYSFGVGDGPLCLDGTAYNMATRDTGSRDLVIFLQGGGARWSELDSAFDSAPPGLPAIGLLNPDQPGNPVANWNVVYLPYCDGGLHASDKDNDYDGDGDVESPQRGLHNLSAALDVALSSFPNPRRILLTGVSGGGFGTTFALPLVRFQYPDVPIELINDSGVGVGRPDGINADQPADMRMPDGADFLRLLQEDWNQSAFLPASCPNCIAEDGHFSDYQDWQLEQDPDVRRAYLSYAQDAVIGNFFLGITGAEFEDALLEEVRQMEDAHPDRVRYWIPDGTGHTFLLSGLDVTAGGVTALDWVTAMLDDTDAWVSVRD